MIFSREGRRGCVNVSLFLECFLPRSANFRLAGDNVTRLQVPRSPDVGWVRVLVKPEAPDPFSFENYVVPRWRIW